MQEKKTKAISWDGTAILEHTELSVQLENNSKTELHKKFQIIRQDLQFSTRAWEGLFV